MKQVRNHLLIGIILLTGMFSTLLGQSAETYRPEALLEAMETYRPADTNRERRQINFRLPFYRKAHSIGVEIVNGKMIFQGDIILGKEALLGAPRVRSAGNFDLRWEGGVIPYVLKKSHPLHARIAAAIETVNLKTNLSLIPRTDQVDYVEFDNTDGCASWVGRQGGQQIINVEKCSVGSIMHEILHAAGLYHEHSRADRDDYVTINWENIKEGDEDNFQTYEELEEDGQDIGRYDYRSIMHYGPKSSSKNDLPTIVPKDTSVKIGQREYLSTGDIRGVRAMYPVKSLPYEPRVVTDKVGTDLVLDPEKNPRLETKKRGGIIKP